MAATREKQPDQERIVAPLASECHLPIGEMATLYERECAELAPVAHVTKYLHIFAIRNVQGQRSRKAEFIRTGSAVGSPVMPRWLASPLTTRLAGSNRVVATDASRCRRLRLACETPY